MNGLDSDRQWRGEISRGTEGLRLTFEVEKPLANQRLHAVFLKA